MIIGIISATFLLIMYWSTGMILNKLNKNQEILLTRLRMMDSTISVLFREKTDKQIQECKEADKAVQENYYTSKEILKSIIDTVNIIEDPIIQDHFNTKTEPTEQHLAILNKVSTGNAKVIHSYRRLTNDLKVKKGDWSVSLEFDEQNNPTCYSIFNKDVLKQVLYPNEAERFLENKQKEEVKKKDNSVKSVQYYKAKILEFIEIKEKTLRSDKDICKEIGLSKECLKIYGEQHSKKIKELHEQCNLKRIEAAKQKFAPKGKGLICQ
jgi:hypothetical protein